MMEIAFCGQCFWTTDISALFAGRYGSLEVGKSRCRVLEFFSFASVALLADVILKTMSVCKVLGFFSTAGHTGKRDL